ncbi:hypothetical protein TTHERM_000783219 (macronuclear) [Tetrahymena thermophila SB210]|uniref:Uncharacterized protein n=1 Tax=Tetrahymena thermophila (strain SB210) TaxID=312017 RepID=W7XL20_TETTS|nr:hypothetical protein TTHERM_000783219 [Tetrahymena thermophila SB210]EWS75524.1 hypothetical protein TTHERM_000783219 [Tetrahymena thermophila SB210]|eukprot:XP_012651993.1 hypothetical protein TTHERM_000783219 [Tetrahymena thermophila SB210]
MISFLLSTLTEDQNYFSDLKIYEKFPYLKEEKSIFNEQVQQLCHQYSDKIYEEEQVQLQTGNFNLDCLGSHLTQSINSTDQTRLQQQYLGFPRFKQIEQKTDSTNADNTFENQQDKSLNLNSQELIDSPDRYNGRVYEGEDAQHSLNNSQEQNQLDYLNERCKRSKRTQINPEQMEQIKRSQISGNEQELTEETKGIIKEGILSSLQQIVSTKLQGFLISNKNPMFYGLDDCLIDLNQIKQGYDGRITYKNKQQLQTVTFLISGYLTQDLKASENFQILTNTKNKESQENLFIFYKWSDSRLFKILDKFLNNIMHNYEPEIYQDYLKELLDSCLQACFNDVIIKGIYWLLELLNMCIKQVGPSFFLNQVRVLKTFLDTTIEDFQVAYEQAKNGGTILAENINNLKLMRKLNIDFMGHSLGAVVTAYAVKNLSMSARYLMLFGGVATVKEIQDYSKKFQMCYNFYSENDTVVKTGLVKAKVVGDQKFVGTIPFSFNNQIFNLNTKIDHLDYMNKYQEYYNLAMEQFKSPSNRLDQPEKINFMKFGLGELLLYLLQDKPKDKQVSIFYLFVLYIYQLFL